MPVAPSPPPHPRRSLTPPSPIVLPSRVLYLVSDPPGEPKNPSEKTCWEYLQKIYSALIEDFPFDVTSPDSHVAERTRLFFKKLTDQHISQILWAGAPNNNERHGSKVRTYAMTDWVSSPN